MDIPLKYNIKGKVVYNSLPMKGVKIESNNSFTYSNLKGEFKIRGIYTEMFSLQTTFPGFQDLSIIAFDGNQKPKTDVGIVELVTSPLSLEQDILNSNKLSDSTIKTLTAPNISFEMIQQKKLNKLLETIQTELVPYVLSLISTFGITNAKKILENNLPFNKTCPINIGLLNGIINKKNKIVKQLNNIYKAINSILKILKISDKVSIGLDVALTIIKNTTIPVPPIVSSNASDLQSQIKKLTNVSSVILVTLNIIRSSLLTLISYLNLLDQLIQSCSVSIANGAGENIVSQEQVDKELLQIQSTTPNPTVSEVNGFIMDIEVESTQSSTKRRRAIAKNNQGVVLLLGEWSYSSIEQILIDELVFYIQVNDLKAY
jgi:hypothetical protein